MGLDMYAFSAKPSDLVDATLAVDLMMVDGQPRNELAYWRKFNALHGWMKALYRSKGGADQDFNCNTVRLDTEDLAALEKALDATVEDRAGKLEPVEGFFFGAQEIYPEDLAATRAFIGKAREAIAAGNVVMYDSWW